MKILIPRDTERSTEMADIGKEYKTYRSYPKQQKRKTASNFKKNVPKKLRKEWGERMNFLRSL